MRLLYPGRGGIWRCEFCGGRKARTNNKLIPHMEPGRNRIRATLAGGERSHHCQFLVPIFMAVILLFPNNNMIFRQEGTRFPKGRNFIVRITNKAAVTSCKNSLNRDHTRTYEHLNEEVITRKIL